MKTLGICIPTYKRPEFLRRCVISALEAAVDRPVRIFIADDSMDSTNESLYQELQDRWHDRIAVHRNPVNLGIDDNIQRAVELCECDYAWIVGEDDLFLPGSVQRMHQLLQETRAPLVLANYAYVGDDIKRPIGQALELEDCHLDSPTFIRNYLWAAGFIGACVVDRELWGTTDPRPYKNSYYTHLGRICDMLAHSEEPVWVNAAPSVANRVEGTNTFTWRHDSYGVFFGFKAMCEAVAVKFPELADAARASAQVMADRYGWLTLTVAMRLRSERGYDLGQYRRYLAPATRNPAKRLAFLLISLTPPASLRPLVAAYRMLRRKTAVTG